MEIYQIRYFLAVSETLNFTRAAERCYVSQPALTKSIQNWRSYWAAVCLTALKRCAVNGIGPRHVA